MLVCGLLGGEKRTDREGQLERRGSGASGGDTAKNISIRGESR